jgi:IS5 family transposase
VAADTGYASIVTIDEAKERGGKAVGLPKKRGMTVEAMTSSEWVYQKLKRFHAGIVGNISMLKRAFGRGRCTLERAGTLQSLCNVIRAGL